MLLKAFCGLRRIHLTKQLLTSTETSPLAVLRKKTGYSFSNCRKALELHSYDATKAEEWLHSQAKALGWAKVTKLQTRETAHGLIGLVWSKNNAAMVEVNCETDFVARNEHFRHLVAAVSSSVYQYCYNKEVTDTGNGFFKSVLSKPDIGNLKLPSNHNKSLSDEVALCVGRLSENISLNRAICVHVSDPLLLSGYTHPAQNVGSVNVGQFGGLVIFRKMTREEIIKRDERAESESSEEEVDTFEPTVEEIGKRLSVHVVGMNPTIIGSDLDEEQDKDMDRSKILIYQECITDQDKKMGEYLDDCGVKVVDFVRFKCGEENDPVDG